jgi:YbbR domain-containing protein
MQNRPTVLRFIVNNLAWMLASLALAVAVWYAAVSAQNPVEQRRLPSRVSIQILKDDGILVVNKPIDAALVTIRAPRSVWDVLQPEDVSVVADVTKRAPGTYTVELRATLSGARQGLVTDIQPSQITVDLARRAEQLVDIDVFRTSEPPLGFTSTYTLSDKQTLVVGPDSQVKQVASAQARISLQDQRSRFTRAVQLVAVDSKGKEVTGVTLTPAEVTLTVDIQPRPDVTELSVVVRLIGELPSGYVRRSYTPDPTSVAVRGDRATIDSMNGQIPTEAIDLTGKTQTFTQRVKLVLPSGVTLVDPVDVTVTVEIEPLQGSREFDQIPVQTQGLDPADYIITVQPDRVNVIVNGPQPDLDVLTPADISVIAPLSGLVPGKYPVTLKASVAKTGVDINSQDIVIPNARAEVTIIARNPTAVPTATPTRPPVPTATPTPQEVETQPATPP